MKKAIFSFFLLFLSMNLWAAPMKFRWDCYLPSVPDLSCDDLKNSFDNLPIAEEVLNDEEVEIKINIRALAIVDGYQFDIEILDVKDRASLKLPRPLRVSSNLQPVELFNRVFNSVVGLATPFFQIKSVQNGSGEQLIVTISPEGAVATPPSSKDETNWFFNPSVSMDLNSSQGNINNVISPNFSANYSGENWLVISGVGGAVVSQKSEPTFAFPGYKVGAQIMSGAVLVGRSFKKHWGIMAVAKHTFSNGQFEFDNSEIPMDPLYADNKATYTRVGAGVEWILVPFIKEDSGNIAIRYLLDKEFHKYVDIDNSGEIDEFFYLKDAFVKHAISLKLSKHYKRLDLAATISAYVRLNEQRSRGAGATASATYYVTKDRRLSVGLNLSANLFKNRVLNPAASGQSLYDLSNGNKNSFDYYVGLTIGYVLGNSLKNKQDQRWKD